MSYQEEKQVRLRRQVSKQAISLALQGNWQESIAVNKSLIENFPNDVDAHNRLGKAYMELGEYALAKEAYTHAQHLDQYNAIAKKNLQRLEHLGEKKVAVKVKSEKAEPQLFIEETGKAAVFSLEKPADTDVLVRMTAGDKVTLKPEGLNLAVENAKNEYLGIVPPKQGQRLIKLIEGGNQYTTAVISVSESAISVIIREVFQSPEQEGIISFPGKRMEELQPYASDRIFRAEFEDEEELSEGAFVAAEDEGIVEDVPEGILDEEKEKTWD